MDEQSNKYPFFANKDCPSFPCHAGVDPDVFNCAFCYCPLYLLGPDCGGDYVYTDSGAKSCAGCAAPHRGTDCLRLLEEHWEQVKRLAARQGATGGLS